MIPSIYFFNHNSILNSQSPDAQRNGINFIYDMNNCKRANYDLALSQKILTLVKVKA